MHFIIFDDDKKFIEKCRSIIFKMMSSSKISYDTTEIEVWSDKTMDFITSFYGNKVFICGEISKKSGIEVALDIRNSGDWSSPIIIVTDKNWYRNDILKRNLLMLEYIFRDDDIEKNLVDSLNIAFKINSCCSCLCIAKDSELYQISYSDILYIEKKLNENYSTIVTEYGEFLIKKSIVSIYEKLENRGFYKTHRSCIVNLTKIKVVYFDKNIIKFSNKQTDLLSRSNKKGLKEILDK